MRLRSSVPAAWLTAHRRVRGIGPGVLVCATIAAAATFVSDHYGGPIMLYALLLGMAFHFLDGNPAVAEGVATSARFVLRLGVALLGVRITFDQIVSLGLLPVLLVVAGVALTLVFGQIVGRWLGLIWEFRALSAVSVSVCGVSAALSAASVLPKHEHSERDTIIVVVTVTALSTAAMIIYPIIASALGLDPTRSGVFLGATIHDVAQVVGAGYIMSDTTGDVATFTKLFRVALLVVVIFWLSLAVTRRVRRRDGSAAGSGARIIGLPWFLVAFLAIVIANSVGVIPAPVAGGMTDISRGCLVTAIAAIGIKTALQDLAAVGWRPIGLMVAETLFLGAFVLVILVAVPSP